MTETQKKFLLRNTSEVFVIAGLAFIGLCALPFLFSFDSRESLVEISGHLKTAKSTPQSDNVNGLFEFTIQEDDHKFSSTHIRQLDQALFSVTEKIGSPIHFSVDRSALDDPNALSVPILKLAGEHDSYLESEDFGGIGRTNRIAAFLFAAVAFGTAFHFQKKLRTKFAKELKEPPKEDEAARVDENLIWVAQNLQLCGTAGPAILFFIFSVLWSWTTALVLSGAIYGAFLYWYKKEGVNAEWVQAALEFKKKQDEARIANRTPTAAPKHLQAITMLLKSGADINIHNKEGKTALHISIAHDNPEAVDLLIRSGANVNLADANGETPLMLAAGKGHVGIVTKLLEKGADILYKTPKEMTALKCAEADAKKNQAVIDILKKAAAAAEAKIEAEAAKQAAQKPS